MKIKTLEKEYSVGKYKKMPQNLPDFYFSAVTKDEISVLAESSKMPENAENCENGFMGFMIEENLEFALIGIISRITAILADNDISVFVVSTFNTDYFFVKKESFSLACQLLSASGYEIL